MGDAAPPALPRKWVRARARPCRSLLAAAVALATTLLAAASAGTAGGLLPFSFGVGGERFGSCEGVSGPVGCGCAPPACTDLAAAGWNESTVTTPVGGNKTVVTRVFTDAPGRSGLQVTAETTLYADVPGSGQTILTFRSTSQSAPSAPVCGVSVADVTVATGIAPTLHSFNGSSAQRNDYQPGRRRLDTPAATPPWGPKENMHGPGGANTVAEGYRLWTGASKVVPHSNETGCVALCEQDPGCTGVTFSHTPASGVNSCFLILPPITRWDSEPGYASWTKKPPGPASGAAAGGFGPRAGRSSDPILPYFAVAGDDAAVVFSVGWSGNWLGNATWDADRKVAAVTVGHEPAKLCAQLNPGEEIRTAAVVSVVVVTAPASAAGASTVAATAATSAKATTATTAPPRLGPRDASPLARLGFNLHRRLMVRHKLPRDPRDGAIKGAMVASWSWIGFPQTSNQTQQLWHVQAVKNTSVEYYWLDAGWFNGAFPNGVGNWEIPLPAAVNRAQYPSGSLAPLGDLAHSQPNPVGFIVWFEPERSHTGTYIQRTFPEYLFSSPTGADHLLNLGDPDANAYIFEYLSSAVTQYGLDVLRIDFNIDPGPFWAAADPPNRTGVSEHRYIAGLYSLWDRILDGHPGLMIDDCSSGGRRIDVETLSRSFPLWRSDNAGQNDPTSHQIMSVGLSQFAPVSSGAVFSSDPYLWRSAGVVGKTISWGLTGWQAVVADPAKQAELRAAIAETQGVRNVAINGDFFPLMDATNISAASWTAYQFDLGGGDEGFAFFFRNAACAEPSVVAGLEALDTGSHYDVTTFTDSYAADGPAKTVSGSDLASTVIKLKQSGSMLLKYTRRSGRE